MAKLIPTSIKRETTFNQPVGKSRNMEIEKQGYLNLVCQVLLQYTIFPYLYRFLKILIKDLVLKALIMVSSTLLLLSQFRILSTLMYVSLYW